MSIQQQPQLSSWSESPSRFNSKLLEEHKDLQTFLVKKNNEHDNNKNNSVAIITNDNENRFFSKTTTIDNDQIKTTTDNQDSLPAPRDFYRSQASAVNMELLHEAEETFDVLLGTESLVLTEFEQWKKRFFDALGRATKASTNLASQYSVPFEMLQLNKENYATTAEQLGVPDLSLEDEEIEKIFEVTNNMDKDEAFYPIFLRSENNNNNNKTEARAASSSAAVSSEIQSHFDRAPLEFQLQSTRQFEDFSSLLRELRINSRSSNASSKTSQTRLLEISDKLNQATRQLLALSLAKFDPVPAIIDMAKALQADPLTTTKLELARLQGLADEQNAILEAKSRNRTGSAIAEHYVLVEEINEDMAECYREMLKHYYEAYKSVELAFEDVDQFQKTVTGVDSSMANLDSALNLQEILLESAEKDVEILDREMEIRDKRRENETVEFSQENERLVGELDSLHQRHTAVWSEVLAKLNELNGINEKIGITKNSITSLVTKNVAVEARHLRDMQAISRLASMRRCVAANVKKGTEALLASKQFASDMLLLISKKEPENVRQKLSLEQCVKYYDTYSAFVTHLQDCAGKKEQRLENSKRLKRSLNFQVEVAGQTFDPLVAKYREQLLGMNDLIEAIEGETKKIHEEIQDGEYRRIWSETVEPELLSAKIPYDEPSQRIQHLRLDMLQRQFAAVDAFHREEQGKLDEERRVVRVMKNLVQQQPSQQQQQQNMTTTERKSGNVNNSNNSMMSQQSHLFSPQSMMNKQ